MILRPMSVLLIVSSLLGQAKIATIDHKPIDEQSAILKSSTYENVFWVINDSGDDPRIFALNEKGQVIIPDFLKPHYMDDNKKSYPGIEIMGAANNDWESLALLGDTLVIADVGNNANTRRDLGVYLVPEPNPSVIYKTRALAWYPVHYEDQKQYPPDEWDYDCEAVFSYQGKIYFLSKHRADRNINKPAASTKLYRMDTRYTSKSNVLKLVSAKSDLGGWITAADIAEDQSGMVMLAQNPLTATIWYFPSPKKGDDFFSQNPRKFILLKPNQAEGICFKDKKTLIVSNEQRDWFEISLKDFK